VLHEVGSAVGPCRLGDQSCTVTSGNALGITGGAAVTVVASERAVERHGLTPLARIVGYAQAEVGQVARIREPLGNQRVSLAMPS
jgi:acetyl-CoA acetyltransferase